MSDQDKKVTTVEEPTKKTTVEEPAGKQSDAGNFDQPKNPAPPPDRDIKDQQEDTDKD